jgi:hypothetical protein
MRDQMRRLDFHAERAPYDRFVRLYLAESEQPDGSRMVATSVKFERIEPGLIAPPAPLELSQDEAQRLMDELWHVGLRPSEGTGSAGAMAAVQAHLQDMRELVFGENA